jgi:hypothetical protein
MTSAPEKTWSPKTAPLSKRLIPSLENSRLPAFTIFLCKNCARKWPPRCARNLEHKNETSDRMPHNSAVFFSNDFHGCGCKLTASFPPFRNPADAHSQTAGTCRLVRRSTAMEHFIAVADLARNSYRSGRGARRHSSMRSNKPSPIRFPSGRASPAQPSTQSHFRVWKLLWRA